MTEEQVRAAPDFYSDDEVWPDRRREQEMEDYRHYRAHELPHSW